MNIKRLFKEGVGIAATCIALPHQKQVPLSHHQVKAFSIHWISSHEYVYTSMGKWPNMGYYLADIAPEKPKRKRLFVLTDYIEKSRRFNANWLNAKLSPDGKKIAIMSIHSDHKPKKNLVFTYDSSTKRVNTWSLNNWVPEDRVALFWLPDSNGWAFTSQRANSNDLYLYVGMLNKSTVSQKWQFKTQSTSEYNGQVPIGLSKDNKLIIENREYLNKFTLSTVDISKPDSKLVTLPLRISDIGKGPMSYSRDTNRVGYTHLDDYMSCRYSLRTIKLDGSDEHIITDCTNVASQGFIDAGKVIWVAKKDGYYLYSDE